MFDFGWAELLIIAAIAVFVIGPQDIPKIAYQIGKFFRRIKYMQFALTSQFDDFMEKAESKNKTPKEPKDELDHDPYNEEEADAELLNMMPLPDIEKTEDHKLDQSQERPEPNKNES
jgi:Tat protein translocase TatB subunit